MTPRPRLLRMARGDATPFSFEVTALDADEKEVPYNLVGSTMTFTAKTRKDDVTALFTRTVGSGIIYTDAANGLVEVRLAAANTASLAVPTTLYWDLQLTDASANPYTIDGGYLFVDRDITT